ncbi:MAG TPA: hypothetical protein VEU27_00895, partial [Gemmatimonadales bacterium]|nr:hypothetical protein [Gemmatimonadales bacterium]
MALVSPTPPHRATVAASASLALLTLPRLCVLLALGPLCAHAQAQAQTPPGGAAPKTSRLDPTPTTVTWGYYAAGVTPALRIRSGETVEMRTLITSSPKRLEEAGVAPADVEPALRDIFDHVTDKGPGGHILTGPVYVEGAEPG